MYYLFFDQDRDRYIQLTFNHEGHVDTHTEWTSTPSTDFQPRDSLMKWSVYSEWLSHGFRYTLVTKSSAPITVNSHPEIFI